MAQSSDRIWYVALALPVLWREAKARSRRNLCRTTTSWLLAQSIAIRGIAISRHEGQIPC
jgi:hypothetical protein